MKNKLTALGISALALLTSEKALSQNIQNNNDKQIPKTGEVGEVPSNEQIDKDLAKITAELLGKVSDTVKLKEGGPEKPEILADFEYIKSDVFETAKSVDSSFNELNPADYESTKEAPEKDIISEATRLADKLEEVGNKNDKFDEFDLGYNKTNTNFSIEIGNYIANAEVNLRDAINFSERAILALSSYKYFAGLAENELNDILIDGRGETTIDPITYDPNFGANPFDQIPHNFTRTKALYLQINSVKKKWQDAKKKLDLEVEKKQSDENFKNIELLRLEVVKLRTQFENLKKEIEKAILQDLAQNYNKVFRYLKSQNQETEENIKIYEQKIKEAENLLKEKYISAKEFNLWKLKSEDKIVLPEDLTGEPYNLTEAIKKNMDEVMIVLRKYTEENSAKNDYLTNDLKPIIRRIKTREGKFENLDDALRVLNKSEKNKITKIIDDYVEQAKQEFRLSNPGQEMPKEEVKDIIEKEGQKILDMINRYREYLNVEELYKTLQEMLSFSSLDQGKNANNQNLAELRLNEKYTQEAFEKYKMDLQANLEEVKEEYKKQAELRKEKSKKVNELIVNNDELKTSNEILSRLEKVLEKIGKNLEADDAYQTTKKQSEKFAEKKKGAFNYLLEIEQQLELSKQKILEDYGKIAKYSDYVINDNRQESRDLKKEVDKANQDVDNQNQAIEEMKSVIGITIDSFNKQTLNEDRSSHDDVVKMMNDKSLELKRELVDKERYLDEKQNDLNNLVKARKFLEKFQKFVLSKLPK